MRAGRNGPLQRILVKSRRALPGGFVFCGSKRQPYLLLTFRILNFLQLTRGVCDYTAFDDVKNKIVSVVFVLKCVCILIKHSNEYLLCAFSQFKISA